MAIPAPLIYAGVVLVAILVLGLIWTRLYRRAPKDAALIRTGFGGEKVVVNGGILVLPVLHELMPVSLTTIKLKVERVGKDSLLTLDKIRVDVIGQFHIRVAPRAEAISAAAQTLGRRINEEQAVSDLVSAKLISSLRSVAASMTMDDLHANRAHFQQEVEKSLLNDLAKNGFELETVSITHFDQTDITHLNENNAFDAEGLTAIKKITENRKRLRNDIEAENRVAIEQRNYEANQQSLTIAQNDEFATMAQRKAVELQRAETEAEIAGNNATREQEAEAARIAAAQATKTRQIEATQAEQEATIKQDRAIALAKQEQQIAIQNKSRDESMAKAEADEARAKAVVAAEAVLTAQSAAQAERAKQIAVIDATREAEQKAVGITVQAKAEKEAAANRAEAVGIAAKAEAEALTTKARGESEAERLRAEAAEVTFRVNAEGERSMNEAKNNQSEASMAFEAKRILIEGLPAIIAEQVKPLASIDSIRIVDVGGLNGIGGSATGADGSAVSLSGGSGNLADQAVSAALKYRVNAPVLESLAREVFGNNVDFTSIGGMTSTLSAPAATPVASDPAAEAIPAPREERQPRSRRQAEPTEEPRRQQG